MCFSPEMDAIAGTVVTLIGIDTLRQVRRPEQLPLAAIPLVLGVHQLVETFVWLHLQGRVGDSIGTHATWIYAFIAFALVPFLVPLAFVRLDLVAWRGVGYGLLAAGTVSGGLGLIGISRQPVYAGIAGHHVEYGPHIPYRLAMIALYLLATLGPGLLARGARLRLFGVLNAVAVAVLVWVSVNAVTSLWCVWAAVTSVLINRYLRASRSATPAADRVRETATH